MEEESLRFRSRTPSGLGLNPAGCHLVLRYLGHGVQCIGGQEVRAVLVEGHEDHARHDLFSDPGSGFRLAPARADHLPVSPWHTLSCCGIQWIHLHIKLRIPLLQRGAPHGHGAAVVVNHYPARGEQNGVFRARRFAGGVFCTVAILALPSGVENLSVCRISVPGCFSSGQGQRRPPTFEILSRVMPPYWGTRRLISANTSRCILIGHLQAQPSGDLADDPQPLLGLPRRLRGFIDPLHAPLHGGIAAILLCPGGSRQDDICQSCRRSHEDLLHHQEIQALQCLSGLFDIGIADDRIFANDIHGLQATVYSRIVHLCGGQARPEREIWIHSRRL